jgi:oligoendopeptidase F
VLRISEEIWNEYYSPVFGGIRDQHILAIYNHYITGSLYLFNYFMGNVIMFQLYDKFMPDNLAGGMKLACREGNTSPGLWMKKAAGQDISIEPLLNAVRAGLK